MQLSRKRTRSRVKRAGYLALDGLQFLLSSAPHLPGDLKAKSLTLCNPNYCTRKWEIQLTPHRKVKVT